MIAFRCIAMMVLPALMTVILNILEKIGKKTSRLQFSVIAGILFGLCAIYGTEFGVDTGMAVLNTRDASVICAGLYFGWPASIISAVIGSVERFLAPLWGVGEYTQMACSIATLCAGIFTSLLVKYTFRDRPKWYKGGLCAAFIEVFHMLMVFVTHPKDLHEAFTVIQSASVPMIAMNFAAVVLAIVAVDIVNGTKFSLPDKGTITVQFNYGLSIAMIIGFVISVCFIARLEQTISTTDTENLLRDNIYDIEQELSNENNISAVTQFRRIGTDGYALVADEDYKVVSISLEFYGRSLSDIGFPEDKPVKQELNIGVINGTESYYMYDDFGNYHIIAVISVYESRFSELVSLSLVIFMELLVFAILYVMILHLVRRLVINNVESVNNNLKSITEGDLNVRLNINTNKEFKSLSNGINSTVDKLKDLISEANARIDAELEFAKRIQTESLPSKFPAFPEHKDFDIFALMSTAKEVGGDFYDFFLTEQNKLIFGIADVSGKGIPAAMFMMRAKTLIRQIAQENKTPAEIAYIANNSLCANNEAGLFVTAWFGSLDLNTGILDYVNAGHNPPLFLRKGEEPQYMKSKSGLVLAGLEDIPYKQYSVQLNPGDGLFLYTDGVTEAANSDVELFGEERLKAVFEKTKDTEDAQMMCNNVLESVNSFAGNEEQFDDITIMTVVYKGKENDN